MLDRRRRMLGDTDFGQCFGIEIGALHSPIVARSEGRILYVDYAPTETLRANLKHPVDPAALVEVDIVWGERPLCDIIAGKVDYAVASHVIEHVPDLIGWLLELHAVLRPGGILGLAVPDRRYTFDFYRHESVLAEMVEAHLLGYRRPSLRQVFESCAFPRHDGAEPAADPGQGGLPGEVMERLPGVYQWVKQELAAASRYVDAHCWVFTPASFLDTIAALARIGCFPFVVARFFPTEPGSIEFHVQLQAVRDSADPAVGASITAAREALAAAAPVAAPPSRAADLERRTDELAAALEAMRHSTCWKLTAPLRAAVSALRATVAKPRGGAARPRA